MSFLVLQTRSGVRTNGMGIYQAVTDDPCFVYRFWVKRPRYMAVLLQGFTEPLDPKLYVDLGSGFDEEESIALEHQAGSCIYCIKVAPFQQVRRLRIDPCSSETRFRYWVGWAWTEEQLSDLLNEAKLEADRGNLDGRAAGKFGTVPVYDVVVSGRRYDRIKNIAQHFAAVEELARRTAPPIDQILVKDGPFISFVVPVFNAPAHYLNELMASFQDQPAGAAELVLCDDGSTSNATSSWLERHTNMLDVRILRSGQNCGIAAATNAGIEVARGSWVGLVDHDDALTFGAVQLIAKTVRDHPQCQFIYTDEVVTDENLRPVTYHLKPAYDDVLLSGLNYINHLSCYRRCRLLGLGGLRSGYNGSQDYDLLLRYLRDLKPEEIKHLPYPAYRWRRGQKSFSMQFMDEATKAARKALAERYRGANGNKAIIDEALTRTLHRVRFDQSQTQWPLVSVIIPSRDGFPLISRILADITLRTDYPKLEIIVVDNGSTEQRVIDLYSAYQARQSGNVAFRCEIEPAPFNFSRQVNSGIALAEGELILLLNNDIEVLDRNWLREMVSCFAYPNVGIVGARLLYPNRRIQHAGVIVGLGGLAGHWFDGQRENYPGPMARLHVRQSFTAMTGACMLISRPCLDQVGSFDEEELAIAYNDVDFCLRAKSKGFRSIWTPFATLIHYESASRGSDDYGARRERFERDKVTLHRRHNTKIFEDPAYNPWHTRHRAEPTLALLKHLPAAR